MSRDTLVEVSSRLGVPPEWLDALIRFESGWDPLARNPISGARGLIQFTDTTARSLGFSSADELVETYPTVDAQLQNPVLQYLTKYKPFPTLQSLFMAVFYPPARYWPPGKLFPESVQRQNPGIRTVADYLRKAIGGGRRAATLAFFLVAVTTIAAVFHSRR